MPEYYVSADRFLLTAIPQWMLQMMAAVATPWTLDYAAKGAGGNIKPGDTVWVRGGTYRSKQDIEITVSGTDADMNTLTGKIRVFA